MTLWKRLKRASEERTGLSLSPDDVTTLMRHIVGTVDEQLRYDDMADNYDSAPEQES